MVDAQHPTHHRTKIRADNRSRRLGLLIRCYLRLKYIGGYREPIDEGKRRKKRIGEQFCDLYFL